MPPSLNDFVGPRQDRCRPLDANCLGGLQVFGTMMCPLTMAPLALFDRKLQERVNPGGVPEAKALKYSAKSALPPKDGVIGRRSCG